MDRQNASSSVERERKGKSGVEQLPKEMHEMKITDDCDDKVFELNISLHMRCHMLFGGLMIIQIWMGCY